MPTTRRDVLAGFGILTVGAASAAPSQAAAAAKPRFAMVVDVGKCIGCQACLRACAKDRSAVIRMSRDGKKARGLCDLCGGDPACVKACPEQCLSIVPANVDGKNMAATPLFIAGQLSRSIYRSGRHN